MERIFKIGMPALVECDSLTDLVDLCLELNLDFIELNMNLPYNFIENIDPISLKKIRKETNIEFTMHMPDEADLGTFYRSVRDGFVDLFLDTIDWSFEAGVKLLNLHIIEGAKMTLPHKKVYIYDKYSQEYLENFIKSIQTLSERAEKRDVILAIENSHNFGKTYIQKVLDKSITYPNIKLTWDAGHDAISNFTDKKYLMNNIGKIAHMHLHDAKGKNDHQIPFQGELDIKELIDFAKKQGLSMLVEVKTKEALRKSIEVLKDHKMI